jgi:nucleotidyltransferase substrate binding protein (TIGR01987 family)
LYGATTRLSLAKFERSTARLQEALQEDASNLLAVDGSIQRFEFAFELAWKTLKRFLQHDGILAQTPREVLEQSWSLGWISDDQIWIAMMRDRNETSHTYDEETAQRIYEHLQLYAPFADSAW